VLKGGSLRPFLQGVLHEADHLEIFVLREVIITYKTCACEQPQEAAALVPMLAHPDAGIRALTGVALGAFKSAAQLDTLVRALEIEQDVKAICGLIDGIGIYGNPEHWEYLKPHANHAEESVRACVERLKLRYFPPAEKDS
jgi:hypothetical protein